MSLDPHSTHGRPASQHAGKRALVAALPHLTAAMQRINVLLEGGKQHAAIAQFFDLALSAIRTQGGDVTCKGYRLPGRTTMLSVCRIPAHPRAEKPIALFVPGLLTALPLAAVRALAFFDLFDIVLCELPGHGASGQTEEVSLTIFAAEYAALIDAALPRAKSLTVIGESLGGLVALALAQQRPDRVRHVILIDTPFHLTRSGLAAWIGETWRGTGSRPYMRRICRDIMGFDPAGPCEDAAMSRHAMVRGLGCDIVHIIGGSQGTVGPASAVADGDLAQLRALNPKMLTTPRIHGTGHAVLLDSPEGARDALQAFIVPAAGAPASP